MSREFGMPFGSEASAARRRSGERMEDVADELFEQALSGHFSRAALRTCLASNAAKDRLFDLVREKAYSYTALNLQAQSLDMPQLENFLDFLKEDEALEEMWIRLHGGYSFERLRDPEYREKLLLFVPVLDQRIGDGDEDPLLCNPEQRGIFHLMAIEETFGTPEKLLDMVKLTDLRSRVKGLFPNQSYFLNIDQVEFSSKQGGEKLKATLRVNMDYHTVNKKGEQVESETQITQFFHHDVDESVSPSRGYKYAYLDLFQLDNRLQAGGVGKSFMRDMAEWVIDHNRTASDHQGDLFEHQKLHAALDVGGFYWARQGFGWDKKGMESLARGALLLERPEDRPPSGVSEKEGLFWRALRDFVKDRMKIFSLMKEKMEKYGLLDEERAGLAQVEVSLQGALDDVLSGDEKRVALVTPQRLAAIGQDVEMKVDKMRNYYLASQAKRGALPKNLGLRDTIALYAGKALMLGSSWFGKLEYVDTGEQGGENFRKHCQLNGVRISL